MTIEALHKLFTECKKVSTDTRNIPQGAIFFALKGENFDANRFVEEALQKGAKYVVLDHKSYYKESSSYILVDDVLQTLQKLSSFHRKFLKLPVLALTGSNGKTTTKELIQVVLSGKFKTVATQGNLNNHIGVPLTLLSMDEATEFGIVEMGANHPGEIAALCEIAAPDYGYITNFGKAHLEGFGSEEGVVKAKSELYQYLQKNDGKVFVNTLDNRQLLLTENQDRVVLEKMEKLETGSEFVSVQTGDTEIHTSLVGDYNIPNITVAVRIGQYFGMDDFSIKSLIEAYKPDNKRSQLIDKAYCKIILDAYNANPTSMEAALRNFAQRDTAQKVVILGDMFELGDYSETEHQKITDLATDLGFDKIYIVGERFFKTQTASGILKFSSLEDVQKVLDKKDFTGKTILIKGSRGMAMERLLDLF